MIFTWTCDFCGWNNDNNNGPCRRCGGQTESRMVRGKWKEVTITERDDAKIKAFDLGNTHFPSGLT